MFVVQFASVMMNIPYFATIGIEPKVILVCILGCELFFENLNFSLH